MELININDRKINLSLFFVKEQKETEKNNFSQGES